MCPASLRATTSSSARRSSPDRRPASPTSRWRSPAGDRSSAARSWSAASVTSRASASTPTTRSGSTSSAGASRWGSTRPELRHLRATRSLRIRGRVAPLHAPRDLRAERARPRAARRAHRWRRALRDQPARHRAARRRHADRGREDRADVPRAVLGLDVLVAAGEPPALGGLAQPLVVTRDSLWDQAHDRDLAIGVARVLPVARRERHDALPRALALRAVKRLRANGDPFAADLDPDVLWTPREVQAPRRMLSRTRARADDDPCAAALVLVGEPPERRVASLPAARARGLKEKERPSLNAHAAAAQTEHPGIRGPEDRERPRRQLGEARAVRASPTEPHAHVVTRPRPASARSCAARHGGRW